MNKRFSFSIKVNGKMGRYSFTAPTEEGYVITNYFCPDSLLIDKDSPFSIMSAIIPQNGELEDEFVNDCQNIVNASNSISNNDITFCLQNGLHAVIAKHVNRCGRLLFQDLLLYIDCYSYLLKAVGYSENEIKRLYPAITKKIVDVMSQYVKDSHTLFPFHVTKFYNTLCQLAK